MQLELASFRVDSATFDGRTQYDRGRLMIDRDELAALVTKETGLRGVQIQLVCPGESARIIHVLDAAEPRIKPDGSIFPGFLGPITLGGLGRTHRLDGVTVMTAGVVPDVADHLLKPKEAIVEMSGPGAALTPLSQEHNVVITFEPSSHLDWYAYDVAIRRAELIAARYLADTTRSAEPTVVEEYRLDPPSPDLPRVVYIGQMSSLGTLNDTFLYGRSFGELWPALLHPNELHDGAIVSSTYGFAGQRNSTYWHQNNPIVHALLRRHNRDIAFVGMIAVRGHSNAFAEKSLHASFAIKQAQMLGATGAVISADGGGHAHTDIQLLVEGCERIGIATTVLLFEMTDPTGSGPSVIDLSPEAVAIVSTGNRDEEIELPKVERAIGGSTLFEPGGDAALAFRCPIRNLYGAISQLGSAALTVAAY